MQLKTWDIFCKIVDNFGDIGVCWRLAKQLANEHGLQVRLFVDDLQIASKLIPTIYFNKNSQIIDNIEIVNFNIEVKPADVVIEAFACGLPEKYQSSLTPDTVWVNLEYLSAEDWVADFHGRHSKIGDLTRYFYFPGFGENTGGLMRESTLPSLPNPSPTLGRGANNPLSISLFCYPTAPIAQLLNCLQRYQHAVMLHVPATSVSPQIAAFFGENELKTGDVLTRGSLTVNILPFLSQADYDALLRSCDLNFVRGEDSWVRAIWAGKPFIWQPYVQTENTHMTKLNAFLAQFYAENAATCAVHRCWSAVNTEQNFDEIWQCYLGDFAAIQALTRAKSQQLARRPDLATKLVEFCIKA